MATVSINTHWVSQALNDMPKIKREQTRYVELKYITKWAMKNNIMSVHLDSQDLIFIGDYLSEEV